MNCQHPIDAATLSDYWTESLDEAETEAVDLHLLACDDCGRRLSDVIELAEGIREVARSGSLRMVVNDTYLRRAGEQGLRVRQYAPPRGGGVQCTVTPHDNLLIGRMAANVAAAKRVDLLWCDAHGVEQARLADIPVEPHVGEVVFQESITVARGMPTQTAIARLVAVGERGDEELLGEYTFNHTRMGEAHP